MQTRHRRFRSTLAMLMILPAGAVLAQTTTRWPAPGPTIDVDFGPTNDKREVRLLDEGLAIEVPVELLMIKHSQVTVQAALPEPGQFKVEQTNPKARVELKDVRVQGGRASLAMVSKIPVMSRSQATERARKQLDEIWESAAPAFREEAAGKEISELADFLRGRNVPLPRSRNEEETNKEIRKAYVNLKILDHVGPQLQARLEEMAEEKPLWVPPKNRLRWKSEGNQAILDDYVILSECQVIDQYLNEVGLGFDSNTSGFQNKLEAYLHTVHLVLSGRVGENAADSAQIARALGTQEVRQLRDIIGVKLLCRFYPEVDPLDANAQWFNGQRVACRASGVASIRVEGHLDPAGHDRVDWWILEGYNPAAVDMKVVKTEDVGIESPFLFKQGARLRVVARGNKPADYALEFRPLAGSSGKQRVVIYESPGWPGANFPY